VSGGATDVVVWAEAATVVPSARAAASTHVIVFMMILVSGCASARIVSPGTTRVQYRFTLNTSRHAMIPDRVSRCVLRDPVLDGARSLWENRFVVRTRCSASTAQQRHERQIVVAILGVPALVAALAMQSPVHVAACDIRPPAPDLTIGANGIPNAQSGYDLHIRFSNTADRPVKRIVFVLNDGRRVVDDGTFAPGATIDHRFDLAAGAARSCTVASATFADGTQWNAPVPDLPQR
jgi:hypothetical protein